MSLNKTEILNRFLSYVAIDTQSDDTSSTFPSTKKQFDMLNLLHEQLKAFGLADVSIDSNGYVMGTLPSNTAKKVPVIGFVAHVDTAPNLVMSPVEFPELEEYLGQTLIVTDGTTLLGADDKAGVTEIMSAIEYLVKHPEIEHGTLKVGFTPDEEVGRGVDFFDVKKFGAEFAYTMDGGGIGELEYENFNAAGAKVTIQGRNIHPGYAKNKMKNAILMAMEFNALLPVNERPEFTQDYEGFYHLIKTEGSVENAFIQYIIRDHDKPKFELKKQFFKDCVDFMNKRYGEGCFTLEMKDQYYNMREMVEPVYHVVATAQEAMEQLGIEPKVVPIRGGTDGARLSYMGLPCPNIFAGGHNFHGKMEYVPLESIVKATEVILKIVELYTQRSK